MIKPKLLDLFCGAGGCSKGYADSGFDVHGVDNEPQKRYPYSFNEIDVFEYMRTFFDPGYFDAIHASPPCQRYSVASARHRNEGKEYPDLVGPIREVLIKTGLPYIIENVVQAPLIRDKSIMLCGTMFNLGVFRHRVFETNFPIEQPGHEKHRGRIGDGKYYCVAGSGGRWKSWGTVHRNVSKGTIAECRKAMGIDWMTRKELVQAIPPAYTQYIGEQLMKRITLDI